MKKTFLLTTFYNSDYPIRKQCGGQACLYRILWVLLKGVDFDWILAKELKWKLSEIHASHACEIAYLKFSCVIDLWCEQHLMMFMHNPCRVNTANSFFCQCFNRHLNNYVCLQLEKILAIRVLYLFIYQSSLEPPSTTPACDVIQVPRYSNIPNR